jgi:hypothetical protein
MTLLQVKQAVRRALKEATYRARLHFEHWRMRGFGSLRDGTFVPYRDPAQGREAIRALVTAGRPAMVARFGLYELRGMAGPDARTSAEDILAPLCFNAGFFPNDPALLPAFAAEYRAASQAIDIFCAWNFRHGLRKQEEAAFLACCPKACLTDIRAQHFLDLGEAPWTAALEGRKVLVVHPLAAQILAQYEKREALFPGTRILPRFASLQCLQAVQSAAGAVPDFPTWFDALAHMKQRMDEADYEVALIGAGAYGLPLAAHAKLSGKIGLHLGGITQLLFGIMGARWEKKYAHLQNSAWTRPDPAARPPGYARVENGCYW